MLGDPRQHPWSDFFIVVEGENVIRPTDPLQNLVGACLSFEAPANPQKGSQDPPRPRRGPLTHGTTAKTLPT